MTRLALIGDCSAFEVPAGLETNPIALDVLENHLNGEPADVFIVGEMSCEELDHVVTTLRSHRASLLAPIYILGRINTAHPLSDWPVPKDFANSLDRYRARRDSLSVSDMSSPTNRILSYLWLLPERTLKPVRNLSNPGIYNYPLLSLFNPGSEAVWLNRALRQHFVEEGNLVDRLRFCPSCDSGRLNYIDRCPHCSSIDIVSEQAIHCFTCGMVANQEQFLNQGRLCCLKCRTTLKHIGTDYDRPFETLRCNDCRQMFVDPIVKIACLDCDTVSKQEDLIVRNIHSYKIAAAGEEYLQHGSEDNAYPVVYGEPVGSGHFLWMLRWLNETRSSEQSKGIIAGLYFSNLAEVDSHLGEQGALRHGKGMQQQLMSLLEKTDLLLRYNDETLFILFPFQPEERLEEFVRSVRKIERSQSDYEIALKVQGRVLPDLVLQQDPVRWLKLFAEELAS